jgi:thiol-disulfide isomerase/thioredoxin
MKKLFCIILFISTGFFCSGQQTTGFEITVSINGLQDSSVYLAYHLGDKQYIKDTINLDKNGTGVLSGKTPLPMGIYMIVLPGNNYFELLISDDQYFGISCSLKDYFNTLKFSGSQENEAFLAYQKNWLSLQEQAGKINQRIQKNQQKSDSLKILTVEQKLLENKMKSYLRTVINENNVNLLSVLVKALLPIDVPEFSIPANSPNPDSVRALKSYLYNKNHFFDNLDLTDERILRTPILDARLNAFFSNVVIQVPDSINAEIDKLIAKCQGNYRIFQYVAVFLFNHFRESEIMGFDAVMVKLADDIYLSGKADWVSDEFITDLRKQIDLIRPNLIGKKAENLVMNTYNGVYASLYDIKKEFTILYFWEPDCGYCQTETPVLKEYYDKVKNTGIEVFAICTQSDKAAWEKYIAENKLLWINGWDPDRLTHFDYYYNVQSTPLVYILDKDKRIIAKKLAVEDIGSFIENYRKYNR